MAYASFRTLNSLFVGCIFHVCLIGLLLSAGSLAVAQEQTSGIEPTDSDESTEVEGRSGQGVSAATLGVVVNVQDPNSVAVTRLYMRERGIPQANLIAVSFSPRQADISPSSFKAVYRQSIEPLGERIQALVLTWTKPYRVGCMSITSAFAMGYSQAYCASGCQYTRASGYFDSRSRTPWTSHGVRPTMMLAAPSIDAVSALIDRGLAADHSRPSASTAYVVQTQDAARSIRSIGHPAGETKPIAVSGTVLKYVNGSAIRGDVNILAYFIGSANVAGLSGNRYLPGAVGDHLTSFGGVLDGNTGQMSILEWIRYGLTGSYGTVVEPCNYPQKFPDPEVFLERYSEGDTLVEAYWKSVIMPGQGLFVGEPLAKPFAD